MTERRTRLCDIDYPLVHETATEDLITDFYIPSLQVAEQYKRAVGYFTSSWFAEAAEGLKGLAKNGGTAQWIISPKLAETDWEAIKKGDEARRDDSLHLELDNLVSDLQKNLKQDTSNTLAWMIADGLLRIKIAVTEPPLSGDFHDKWGIITGEKDSVAFHGSQNDSKQSLKNYESNSIFTTWRGDIDNERVKLHDDRFDDLWNNRKQGVQCFTLPDSVNLDIVELRTDERPYNDPGEYTKLTTSYRWRHQEEAVNEFIESGEGILQMATGTGKTRTSLKILNYLIRNNKIENLVIATYGNDLLNQWETKIHNHFSADEVFLYKYFFRYKELGNYIAVGNQQLDILLTSYSNLAETINADINNKLSNALLICDEIHNMGSDVKRASLSGKLDRFPYRLGLSATPFDPYDEERNEFLRREVGPIIYEFGLEPAIRRGILCEFEYSPLMYELSEEDIENQKEAFKKFAGLRQQNPSIPKSQLYIMLSRVRKESEEKLPVFTEYLRNNPNILDNCIIFVETKDYGLKVQKIIFDFIDHFHTYYGEDDESKLREFAEGKLSTLITSRAISEGIDIQSIKNIILFTAPRSQGRTVQRIGRALRKNPADPGKKANIIDFVVQSDIESSNVDSKAESDNMITEEDSLTPPDKERYEWLTSLSMTQRIE